MKIGRLGAQSSVSTITSESKSNTYFERTTRAEHEAYSLSPYVVHSIGILPLIRSLLLCEHWHSTYDGYPPYPIGEVYHSSTSGHRNGDHTHQSKHSSLRARFPPPSSTPHIRIGVIHHATDMFFSGCSFANVEALWGGGIQNPRLVSDAADLFQKNAGSLTTSLYISLTPWHHSRQGTKPVRCGENYTMAWQSYILQLSGWHA